MAFPNSHKTVFVLDRGPFFTHSSKQSVDFDVITRSRGPGFIPLAPVVKSLWTCNVEAIIEYCRIMYDIHPTKKLVRIIVSDTNGASLNSWTAKEQNLQQMMIGFALIGSPRTDLKKEDCSVTHGLLQAVEALGQATQDQLDAQAQLPDGEQVINRGRIVCVTHMKNENQVKVLEECVHEAVKQHNKEAADKDEMTQIDHIDLVLLHITPVGMEGPVRERPCREICPALSCEVHTSQSGRAVALKMVQLVMKHLRLSSTTITGIPMKEEQNASSSANYDVELLHASDAHTELINSGQAEGLVIQSKEGLYSSTVTLKWLTPKTSVVEMQQCSGAYRITPVDVNSRPSSCLTNFLLNGRSVMLEQPRKTGTKVVSHMLTSHGGEIYIHVLVSSRSILEDPPSISEGSGGRVTDYRITNYGEFMKETRLAPAGNIADSIDSFPIERAKAQLERMTRYWPLTIGDTIIFNMLTHIQPLPSLIMKERLTADEVLECKKVIYHVVSMESRNEPLPVPVVGSRGKGPKREEQYRQMWSEFETLIQAHAETSPNHQKVLECLLECKRPTEERGSPQKAADKVTVKEEPDQAWKEYDKYSKMTEREKLELNKGDRSISQPPTKRMKQEPDLGLTRHGKEGQSLRTLWTAHINSLHAQRHNDFDGRKESKSNRAELYINLNESKDIEMQGQTGSKR